MSWWNATTVLHYVGSGGGGHHMWFFSRLPTATQCQNLRIHIILLAGKYFFKLVPSRLFYSFWAEPIIRWAKTGDPREKPPDHPQAELGLSHMWPELGSNPQRWDDERFRSILRKSHHWPCIGKRQNLYRIEWQTVIKGSSTRPNFLCQRLHALQSFMPKL